MSKSKAQKQLELMTEERNHWQKLALEREKEIADLVRKFAKIRNWSNVDSLDMNAMTDTQLAQSIKEYPDGLEWMNSPYRQQKQR